MRMSAEHFDALRTAIEPLDVPEARKQYAEHKLSDERYRWDLFWRVRRDWSGVDADYADAHIDTALRRITATLDNDNDTGG